MRLTPDRVHADVFERERYESRYIPGETGRGELGRVSENRARARADLSTRIKDPLLIVSDYFSFPRPDGVLAPYVRSLLRPD